MLRCASIAALMFASAAAAQTPGFWLVGFPPGGTGSLVRGLSQDGSVGIGGSDLPNGVPGFTWTRAGGRDDFGLEPGMPFGTPATAVSGSGGTLAGYMSFGVPMSPPGRHAYRRVGNGPLQDLGVLPGETRSYAAGVSGDGSIVVGTCEHSQFSNAFGQAFAWTESGGMQGLGYLRPNGTFSTATAISRDGSTVVGHSQSGFGAPREAFVWTESSGMQGLPILPGSPSVFTYAEDVSANGSVVVGMAGASNGWDHAVRWVDGQIEDLALLIPGTHSVAYAVSDDGQVIGGAYQGFATNFAFVWTPDSGMIDLADFLSMHGFQVPAGYHLQEVWAISGDGLTFAGSARNLLTNLQEGFVATIPCPATFMAFLSPLLARRRRRS